MNVRRLCQEDIAPSMALLKRSFDEMGFDEAGHGFDETTITEVMQSPLTTGFVCDGGVGIFIVSGSICDKNTLRATEVCWHSDPLIQSKAKRLKIMLALLDAMESEVRRRGIKVFTVSSSVKFPAISRLLCKKGYAAKEIAFVKGI